MPRTLREIFWIQAKSQSSWANLQHCSDRNDAVAAFERYAAQGRFDEVRLVRAENRKRRELYEAMMVARQGVLLSKAETEAATAILQADGDEKETQMLICAVVFLLAIGAGAMMAHFVPGSDHYLLDFLHRLAG